MEVIKNTDYLNRYRGRRARLSRRSIINSVADTLFMVLGFFLARWWPVWLTVTVAVALELIVGYMTRDQSHAQCADAVLARPVHPRLASGTVRGSRRAEARLKAGCESRTP
jgi:uncharacterized protein DUF2585